MFLCVYWSIPGINETNVMAGIAPLKAHPVKMSYNERSQPSKKWNGGRHIARSAIYSTRDSAVTTVTIESYTLFPSPLFYIRSC